MGDVREIDVHQSHDLIKQGNVTIVDIRDAGSFEESHLKGAISVNSDNIETLLKEADKNKPLLCYCYHGISSLQVAQYFKSRGFETVYSMGGGIETWRQTYPVSEEGS